MYFLCIFFSIFPPQRIFIGNKNESCVFRLSTASKKEVLLFKTLTNISANNANYSNIDYNWDSEIRFHVEQQQTVGFNAFEGNRTIDINMEAMHQISILHSKCCSLCANVQVS